jgi:hypothetical protein
MRRSGYARREAGKSHDLGLQVPHFLAGDVGQRAREFLGEIARSHEMTIYAGSTKSRRFRTIPLMWYSESALAADRIRLLDQMFARDRGDPSHDMQDYEGCVRARFKSTRYISTG